jgi:hypothetical protein
VIVKGSITRFAAGRVHPEQAREMIYAGPDRRCGAAGRVLPVLRRDHPHHAGARGPVTGAPAGGHLAGPLAGVMWPA